MGHTAARLLVLVEERHSGEGFGAVLALVFLHVRVSLKVGPEVGPVRKRPAAVGTREGLLTCHESNTCQRLDATALRSKAEPKASEGLETQCPATAHR